MRILHVGPVAMKRASGLPKSILGLASAQAAIGLKVGVLSSLPFTQQSLTKEVPGVCPLGAPDKPHHNPWLISKHWIHRIREKFGTPDLVNFHSTYVPFHTALARRCRQAGWPYVITAHGVMGNLAQNVKHIKKSIGNLLFFRSYVKHAEAIHALTAGEADEIQMQFDVKKVIIVPNGVDDYLLDASLNLSPADLGDFGHRANLMLGFVGRIDMYHKGIDLLLKAIAILNSPPCQFNFNLFVIGPFHRKKDERSFHSMIESLKLNDNVNVLGPKYGQEKLRYLLACDVFVHTSRFEGMPVSVLEAMALGRPCLVTPGSNVADIVCEGGGWKCEASPRSIAEMIKSILGEKDSLRALGQQSRELMEERFTWKSVAQQLYKEHLKLCGMASRTQA